MAKRFTLDYAFTRATAPPNKQTFDERVRIDQDNMPKSLQWEQMKSTMRGLPNEANTQDFKVEPKMI